jgi:hypothetical protein
MRSRVGRDVAVTLVISYHLARDLYTGYDSRSLKLRLATFILPDLDQLDGFCAWTHKLGQSHCRHFVLARHFSAYLCGDKWERGK